jgi:hypothetical protein
MMTKPLCIYHGHCDDGFAAAWAARHALGANFFEFYPGVYQQAPPDVTGRHVLMVDFSYKRPVLMGMAATARSIVILDHHKTAAEDLADFRAPAPFEDWFDGTLPRVEGDDQPIAALFDMNRSGAGLTWDFFHPGEPRPLFIDYVEDRDLWLKQRPGGDEFTIALRSYPQDFAVWDGLVAYGAMKLVEEGAAIQRYYRLRVEELKRSAYQASIAGAPFWVANAPYFAASEVAGELAAREHGFGACYFEASQGRWQYSLRARGDFDVSEIARKFGGGGHKSAAGFTTDAPVHDTTGWGDGH